MDQKAKLEELKRQAEEIGRKFAELTPVLRRRLEDVNVCIAFDEIAEQIARTAPAVEQTHYLGAVRA